MINRQGVPGSRPLQPMQRTQTAPPGRLSNGKQILNGQMWGQPSVLGQSRPGMGPGAASFAQAVSSSGLGLPTVPSIHASSTSLDPSDFPALGSVGSQAQAQAQVVRSNQSPRPVQLPPGLQQPVGRQLPQQQQQSQQQQQQPSLLHHTGDPKEDFPALPGVASVVANNLAPAGSLLNSSSTTTMTAIDSTDDMNKFGMGGLLSVIQMENNDQTTVAIGSDVNQMGLNFNAPKKTLSKEFSSPWVGHGKHRTEPEFELPACYNVPSAAPQQEKIQNLTEESLFYIFYTMPRDSMQEAAAQELVNRNWRYHKELKLWLTKDPLSEPIPQANQAERGIYVFFDPSQWQKVKKEYVLRYADIA